MRAFWLGGQLLFRLTPRPCFRLRSALLRLFGARIGQHVHVYNTVQIEMPWNLSIGDWAAVGPGVLIYNPGRVHIGPRATVSHRAHLCAGTHDHRYSDLPLLKKGIRIAGQAWICADAFVGPGVRVGEGSVVGARAVVIRKVPAWKIVGGNPARLLKDRVLRDAD